MNHQNSLRRSDIIFFVLLTIFCCLPIWLVDYFINHDGSAHIYSAKVMLELIKGNPQFSEIFAFNSVSIPNSSGHWFLVLLLSIFSSFTSTKIIVTSTFAGFVAACGWLRLKTAGANGIKTSLLIGAAIGFNWLWFSGFYNFIIGAIIFTLTVSLFYNWREKMNVWRTFALCLLVLITYFSHLIAFGILAGSLFLLAISVTKAQIKKSVAALFLSFLPIIPLMAIYKSLSVSGGEFAPAWRNLDNPFSPISWFSQLRGADAFIIISRKAFPFVENYSSIFALFTPLLWMLVAFAILLLATFISRKQFDFKKNYIFGVLFILLFLAALFLPDDFGINHGSILRERVLICALVFIIPFFQIAPKTWLKRIAQTCLIFVVIIQTLAIWEYALKTDREAKEYLTVQPNLNQNDSIASVTVTKEGWRFHSQPMVQFDNYLGVENNLIVWDNYEPGYYVFPIITRNSSDKNTFYEIANYNFFVLDKSVMSDEKFTENAQRLIAELKNNNTRPKTLILSGREERLEMMLSEIFQEVVILENGNKIYYRK